MQITVNLPSPRCYYFAFECDKTGIETEKTVEKPFWDYFIVQKVVQKKKNITFGTNINYIRYLRVKQHTSYSLI